MKTLLTISLKLWRGVKLFPLLQKYWGNLFNNTWARSPNQTMFDIKRGEMTAYSANWECCQSCTNSQHFNRVWLTAGRPACKYTQFNTIFQQLILHRWIFVGLLFSPASVISTIKMKHKQLENISTHQNTDWQFYSFRENKKKVMVSIEKKGKSISLESLTHSTEAWIYNLKQEVGVGWRQ